MNCADVRECLPLLDREDAGRQTAVSRHTDFCPACAAERDDVQAAIAQLREGTSDLLSDPPTASEWREMLAGVPREEPRRGARWIAAAVGVALVAGAAAFFLLDREDRPAPSDPPVVAQDPEPEDTPEKQPEKKPETDKPPAPIPEEPKPVREPQPVEFSLELRWKAAEHLWRTRKWDKAILAYREIAERSRTGEEQRKYGVPALMKAGECLYRNEEFRAAYETYDRIVRESRKVTPDIAADAAYYRYRSATALVGATRTRANDDLRLASRDAFFREFPTHPRAMDLGYYLGAEHVSAGDMLKVTGSPEAARKEYRLAIDDYFTRVTRSAALYLKARARIGEALYKLGQYDEALAEFVRVLDPKRWTKTTDPFRLASQRHARAIATVYGARCHQEKGDWAAALEILKEFESLAGTEEGKLFARSVVRKRAEALTGLGRTKEAISEYEKLAKGPPDPLAPDLVQLGLLLEKTGELERAEKILAQAVSKRELDLKRKAPLVIRDTPAMTGDPKEGLVGSRRDLAAATEELKTWRVALERVRAALGR